MSSAPRQRALPLLHHSYELMRRSNPLPPSSVPLIRRVFAGCHQSLLRIGPSRCYLHRSFRRCLDPYPGGFPWCSLPFLPMESSAFSNLSLDRLSHHAPVKRLLTGPRFRGCSHSVMFRPQPLLVTLVAPTLFSWAAVTFTSEHLMNRYLIMPRIC